MLCKKSLLLILALFFSVNAYSQFRQENVKITTRLSEKFLDKSGNPLTGKGVIVGDMDSGIDVFHPFFFFADGGEFNWIDVNDDSKFTPGTDAVDMNKNGEADKGETLNFIKINDGTYQLLGERKAGYEADMDFLYNDKNGDKKREFGEKDGFTEQTPTYGEQLFIMIDKNGNNKLDNGEKLVALKTSKVRAVRQKDGVVRRRGVDLIKTEADSVYEHGTSVASIVMGGHYGVEKIHGIAPDAEMVFANIDYAYTPRFVRNFPDLISFLRGENINILLIEDGEYMWEFMDGSSEEEQMLNQAARDGITVIGGSGNLSSAKAHFRDTLSAGETETYGISAAEAPDGKKNDGVFATLLWKDEGQKLNISVKTPRGETTPVLSENQDYISTANYHILYKKEVSSKGTVKFDFAFSEKDSGTVDGDWKISVTTDKDVTLNGFVGDISQSWSGDTHWTNHVTDEGDVTFPPTADSCISVGAYTVNIALFPGDVVDNLCTYSGIGNTVDGRRGVNICAPGHATFAASPGYSCTIFSGTSSAAPHVVGTAALLLQYDPSLTHTQVRNIIEQSALTDSFTGSVPNPRWGWGKLNTENAVRYLQQNNPY